MRVAVGAGEEPGPHPALRASLSRFAGEGLPPRIPSRIDGEDLQFLFDSGATFRLDEAASARLGDASVRQRAGGPSDRVVPRAGRRPRLVHGLGHREQRYADATFRRHLLRGLRYAAGESDDC